MGHRKSWTIPRKTVSVFGLHLAVQYVTPWWILQHDTAACPNPMHTYSCHIGILPGKHKGSVGSLLNGGERPIFFKTCLGSGSYCSLCLTYNRKVRGYFSLLRQTPALLRIFCGGYNLHQGLEIGTPLETSLAKKAFQTQHNLTHLF